MIAVSPEFLRALSEPAATSLCNVCRCLAVREHVPWNHEWSCNGDHSRCTMIGCVPVLSEPPARD